MTTTTSSSSGHNQATPRFSLDGVPPYLPPRSGAPKSVLMKEFPRAKSTDETREALDKALQRPTWTLDKPFEPSPHPRQGTTGFTSLAAVVGAIVTASVGATPWVVFFIKR